MNTNSNKTKKCKKVNVLQPVQEIRENLKLSQANLSRLMGLRQSQISACELGRRNLSIRAAKKLIAIAKEQGFNYTLDFIYPD